MSSQGRNFSYETNDDNALTPQRCYSRPSYNYQPYHDSTPQRDIISPPPQYSSPAPQEPVSPTRAYHGILQQSRYSPERAVSRRAVPNTYSDAPPPPPPHQSSPRGLARLETQQPQPYRPTSLVTPGMDNFSDRSQGGGLGSVAQNVADRNERESGLEAMGAYNSYDRDYSRETSPYPQQPRSVLPERSSYNSNMGLAYGAATPGTVTPTSLDPHSSRYSARSIPLDDYPSHSHHPYNSYDSPYNASSQNFNNAVSGASINPHNIVDDGDDGFIPDRQRKSMFAKQTSNESGAYKAVGYDGAGSGKGEKSEWLSRQKKGSNKMRWMVGGAIGLVIVIAIVAGIVGGVLSNKNNGSSGGGGGGGGSTNNAADDLAQNGDLNSDSSEIKKLMNNKDLHKVFPAMDYTPWGTQYPDCMKWPPSQNNVTRDMAVLSQLTNQVRLYGTDCNQTQMVLHAIDRLKLDDMKVWMGVWIDTNTTTTERQIKQMYEILDDTKDLSIYKGVIIGNEALYRAGEDKAQSQTELETYLHDARDQFLSKGYDLKIATSDLGDNWNAELVQYTDFVMSNIHPFFAGVSAEEAAGWTYSFWQNKDVPLTKGDLSKQIISETGWPSDGGEDCGVTGQACAPGQSGAVASVDGMNTFMNDWVCQALENGTDYFWFEAFDEPWKVRFNTADENWEDKWGLMYPDRTLKPGLKIPDCDGKTVKRA